MVLQQPFGKGTCTGEVEDAHLNWDFWSAWGRRFRWFRNISLCGAHNPAYLEMIRSWDG